MPQLVFSALLRLLPRHRRDRYGDELRDVFDALAAERRARAGVLGVTVLLMSEVRGLLRFSLRDRLARFGDWQPFGGGWHPLRELHWAWRGVRARGWRAVFIVVLFAVVLAANTVVFSAADAFIFRTVPYPAADRLAGIEELERDGRRSTYLPVQVIEEWRRHRDLFTSVQAHDLRGAVYVDFAGVTETIAAERVTPGLFELLGVVPAWGRPFVEADVQPGAAPVVVIGELVARRLFGTPESAVGQKLPAGKETSTVIGVMPASFRFPAAADAAWFPLSLEPDRIPGLLSTNRANIVRLAPGVSLEDAADAVSARSAAVSAAIPPVQSEEVKSFTQPARPMVLRSLHDVRRHSGAAIIFAMLAGAAVCLLLIACSNVASLELAAAPRRARDQAVLAALGASRVSQARVAVLEGACLLAGSVALAVPLALWATEVLSANLTAAMRDVLLNPIDVDPRAILAMLTAATVAVTTTSIPALRRLSRIAIFDALRDDARVMPATRGATRTRQLLMTAQVALTVLLLVGGALYLRSYLARLGIDRGFDDRGLVTIEVLPASDAPRRGPELEAAVLERLRSTPVVRSVSRTSTLFPSTQAGITGKIWIDGTEQSGRTHLSAYLVDPEFFPTTGMPMVQGRPFGPADGQDHAVITERMAQRFWPGGSAVGGRFRVQGAFGRGRNQFVVAGVVRDFRQDRLLQDTGEEVFVFYAAPSVTSASLTFVARVRDERQLATVAEVVRAVAERSVIRTDTIAARYARLDGDKRLAASITSGFGVLAFVVATAGIYGVMAFLVAGRRREIGIRMALGADAGAVQRFVFRSSLAAVLAGATVGVAAALIASRWIASQLYGVTATNPGTYAAVCAAVVGTALLATWVPARRAARIDPAITLKAE